MSLNLPKPPFQSVTQADSGRFNTSWQQWIDRIHLTANALTNSGPTSSRPSSDLYTGQPYFDTEENQLYIWNGSYWMPVGATSGTTAERPASDLYVGQLYFDTTQNQLFAWNGSIWIANGPTAGTTANRPTQDLYQGRLYFDTTRGQMFFYTGSAWRSTRAGYYGVFYDNTNQTAGSTTTAYPITFNTPNGAWNVTLSSSSHINFPYSGVYNIQFSIQFINTDGNANNPLEVNVWLRKNGSDVAESNSQFTVPAAHGGNNGAMIAALNLVIDLADNDYIELMWQTENTNISIKTLPAGTTPTTPVTPSVILTATQV